MQKPLWYTSASVLLIFLSLQFPSPAEAVEPQEDSPKVKTTTSGSIAQADAPSRSAADLQIRPRVGVGHTSSGAGFDGVTQFEGFLPLWQNPGSDLLFFQGRFLLDNDANAGANLQLGYRHYDVAADRILGGYVAFDNRETDASNFNQLGIGFESLGRIWDFRVNGYIPLGDRRDLVESRNFDTGTQFLGTAFQDHYLLASTRREQQQFSRYETALGGLDVEVGARLLTLGETGDVRGFGGLYYYGGPGTEDALGWRLRLQARPTDYLTTGITLQHDDIFGTNFIFGVGATFPGSRPRGLRRDQNAVYARMGESIERVASITVDQQVEQSILIEETSTPVTNPNTGEPWFFNHVTLGATNGDGTFENPYGTVQGAIGTIPTDGNGIVYVAIGDNADIPAFTVPGGVWMLSRGPVQEIPTVEFGPLRLPFSGDGNFPTVLGTATLDSSPVGLTVLSGFNINPPNGPGVAVANTTGDVEIRDNFVNSPFIGVYLSAEGGAASGNVLIRNNQIEGALAGVGLYATNGATFSGDVTITENVIGSGYAGVGLYAASGATFSGDVTIASNQISGDAVGIGLSAIGATLSGNFAIANNTINGGYAGVALSAENATVSSALTLQDNSIQGDSTGVSLDASGSTIDSDITLSGNTITATEGEGVYVYLGESTFTGTLNVTDNAIESQYTGIELYAYNSNIEADITLSGNTITATEGTGIYTYLGDSTFTGTLNVTENTIESQYSGIELYAYNSNIEADITLSGNTITAAEEGVYVYLGESTFTGTLNVTDNTIESQYSGIELYAYNSDIAADITLSGNTITATEGEGVYVYLGESTFTGTLNVTNNAIESQYTGIELYAYNSEVNSDITLSGNTITAAEGTGVYTYLGESTFTGTLNVTENTIESQYTSIELYAYNSDIEADITLSGNTITATEGTGIYTYLGESTFTGTLNVTDNTIESQYTGIELYTYNSDIAADITVSSNTISSSTTGIELASEQTIINGNLTFADNEISDAEVGINVELIQTDLTGNTTVSGNTIESTERGISISAVESTIIGNLAADNNTVEVNSEEATADLTGIEITLGGENGTVSLEGDISVSGNTIEISGPESEEDFSEYSSTGVRLAIAASSTEETSTPSDVTGNITISNNRINVEGEANLGDENEPNSVEGGGINLLIDQSFVTGDISILNNTVNSDEIGIFLSNRGNNSYGSEIDGSVTISGNDIMTDTIGIAVNNYSYSTINDGISISDNTIQVTDDQEDELSIAAGISVTNLGSTIDGGVTISGNDITSDFLGVSISNYGYSSINDGISISSNTIQVTESQEDESPTGISINNNLLSTIDGGVTISGNDITSDFLGVSISNYSYSSINDGISINNNAIATDSTAIVINNSSYSSINDGITIDENTLEVAGGTGTAALVTDLSGLAGVAILNSGGSQIQGEVSISGNAITIEERDGDITSGIVVANFNDSLIQSNITISDNRVTSNQYGITVLNGEEIGDGSQITGAITITGNTVNAEDDGIGLANLYVIEGNISISTNTIVSNFDDGIDFANFGTVEGDVEFETNLITAGGDEIKCQPGVITGSEPAECSAP